MRKAEQRLFDTMKRNKPRSVELDRIENACSDGMPDVLVSAPGIQRFVELKAPTAPKRASTPLLGRKEGLRPSQIAWFHRQCFLGLPSYILIRDDSGHLFLIYGTFCRKLNKMTLEEIKTASIASNWDEIYQQILTRR